MQTGDIVVTQFCGMSAFTQMDQIFLPLRSDICVLVSLVQHIQSSYQSLQSLKLSLNSTLHLVFFYLIQVCFVFWGVFPHLFVF